MLEICFWVLMIAFTVFCTYYGLICPVILSAIKYKLFAARDELRWLGITDPTINYADYQYMEIRLNGCIGLVPAWSIRKLLVNKIQNRDESDEK
ncbi:MAG: hypothetical protein LBP59_10915 [Planctomycetaceae bacterium]|jgi:hypothetical protein|nr:hypothetical protein [Planctomycetaceae bacterium]